MSCAGARLLIKLVLAAAAIVLARPADAETRLALVITNAAYPSEIGALANPHKDGMVIAAGLQSVGFERDNITIVRDADQPTLRLAVAEFVPVRSSPCRAATAGPTRGCRSDRRSPAIRPTRRAGRHR